MKYYEELNCLFQEMVARDHNTPACCVVPGIIFFSLSCITFSKPSITWDHTVNRTYGTHKKLYISLFLLTIFGPTYYGPP